MNDDNGNYMYGVNNDDDKIDDNLEIINNTNDIDNTKIKNDYDCDHDNDDQRQE